jgi:hypothetical protein
LELKEMEQVLLQKIPRPAASRFSDVTKGALHFLQFTVRRLNIATSMFNFNTKQGWRQSPARSGAAQGGRDRFVPVLKVE